MLDIGWTELLVIAVVLIVVVGPKDLPPMLRAFGKMTGRLRKTAGEFRAQFDEALREAELDDVRKTISDVKNLNPASSLRDAINPLRQMGNEIKADLKKATQVETFPVDDSSAVTPKDAPAQPMTAADLPPLATLPATPPVIPPAAPAPQPAVSVSEPVAPAAPAAKRVRKPKAGVEPTPSNEALTVAPTKAPRAASAAKPAASAKPPAKSKVSAKASPAETPAKKPAAKKTAGRKEDLA
ncbi:twin-arginine translocase subunit TatB [Agrobacterium sp. a22-2]|uniref:Sec-independent protein translocase protein TatB n=1 Tax=Agrobacterium sp. a22-2 TaxID=2283840 RepID=UPI0014464050|nr:Sec-independent protein translocase protein TatB [Agrobacterium sp. a22-2]NKN36349.1 twin-arginine translocase subunit TatB [Agrobacterium sp. a22-2]